MFIASIFNRRELFQTVGGWRNNSDENTASDLDILLFRSTSAFLSLRRMHKLSRLCVQQYQEHKDQLDVKRARIVFWSPIFVELLDQFSPFLSSIRIMQNMALPLVAKSKKLKTSVPLSLDDAMKRLEKYGFGSDICTEVQNYWENGGKEIKYYRDIDQHFYAIIEHSFLQVAPEEKTLIFLPDNPNEKSPKRWSFENERDALPFFENAFVKTHDLFENLARLLGFEPMPIKQSFQMAQLGSLTEGTKTTLALIVDGGQSVPGLEIGQTEEGTIYARKLPIKKSV